MFSLRLLHVVTIIELSIKASYHCKNLGQGCKIELKEISLVCEKMMGRDRLTQNNWYPGSLTGGWLGGSIGGNSTILWLHIAR